MEAAWRLRGRSAAATTAEEAAMKWRRESEAIGRKDESGFKEARPLYLKQL
jgi:hypothetical protein